MKHTYTIEAIAEALQENQAVEIEDGNIVYYLHLGEDGEILPTMAGEAKSLTAVAQYDDCEDMDDIYSLESLDNADFRAVVESLTAQANAWLEERI